MAISVIGYPQEANYCPQCGSQNIETHDQWHESGLLVCRDCECRCVIVDAEV